MWLAWGLSRHIDYFQKVFDIDRIFAWYTSTAICLDIVSQVINKNYNYNKIPQIKSKYDLKGRVYNPSLPLNCHFQ